jgi:hypothetical protein
LEQKFHNGQLKSKSAHIKTFDSYIYTLFSLGDTDFSIRLQQIVSGLRCGGPKFFLSPESQFLLTAEILAQTVRFDIWSKSISQILYLGFSIAAF